MAPKMARPAAPEPTPTRRSSRIQSKTSAADSDSATSEPQPSTQATTAEAKQATAKPPTNKKKGGSKAAALQAVAEAEESQPTEEQDALQPVAEPAAEPAAELAVEQAEPQADKEPAAKPSAAAGRKRKSVAMQPEPPGTGEAQATAGGRKKLKSSSQPEPAPETAPAVEGSASAEPDTTKPTRGSKKSRSAAQATSKVSSSEVPAPAEETAAEAPAPAAPQPARASRKRKSAAQPEPEPSSELPAPQAPPASTVEAPPSARANKKRKSAAAPAPAPAPVPSEPQAATPAEQPAISSPQTAAPVEQSAASEPPPPAPAQESTTVAKKPAPSRTPRKRKSETKSTPAGPRALLPVEQPTPGEPQASVPPEQTTPGEAQAPAQAEQPTPARQAAKKGKQPKRARAESQTVDAAPMLNISEATQQTPPTKKPRSSVSKGKNKTSEENTPAGEAASEGGSAPQEQANSGSPQSVGAGSTDAGTMTAAALLSRKLHEYYCIPRPMFDLKDENFVTNELSEEQVYVKYNALVSDKSGPGIKPIAWFPNHRWICMWQSRLVQSDLHRMATYRCPENFDMHIYNDFWAYGVQELMENQLLTFDAEFKNTGDDRIDSMWGLIAGIIVWMLSDDCMDSWIQCDDAERVRETSAVMGIAFVTTLNELDLAGLLTRDSRIKDLDLVMAMMVLWPASVKNYGIRGDAVRWRREVVGYAKKAGIDLTVTVPYGIKKVMKQLVKEEGAIPALAGPAKVDRWGWPKALRKFKRGRKIGGEKFNICRFSRAERKKYNSNGVDPLIDIPDKDLKNGNLYVG